MAENLHKDHRDRVRKEFLANGFEECEALAPIDILRRAGFKLETVGVNGKIAVGSHNIPVTCDITIDEAEFNNLEAIILPGGMPGTLNLERSEVVSRFIEKAAEKGAITLDKLEAMTCVCSVGLDMIAVPGDTSAETISAIIADEAAIGMVNCKTTAVRVIPAPGKKAGDTVNFGGLFGFAPIMEVNGYKNDAFIQRGGRIPAPLHSLRN